MDGPFVELSPTIIQLWRFWLVHSCFHDNIRNIPCRNPGTNPDLGSGETLWGAILNLNINKSMAQKLRRNILLHFGVLAFKINFGTDRQSIIFIVSEFGGRVHDSQNQCLLSLDTPNYSKIQEHPESFLKNIIWGNLDILKIGNLLFFGNDARRSILKIRLICF